MAWSSISRQLSTTTIRTAAIALILVGLASCGPFYKNESPGHGDIPFFARVSGVMPNITPGSLLLVETGDIRRCADGKGAAVIRLMSNNDRSQFTLLGHEVQCESLSPVTAPELAELFPEDDFRSAEPEPQAPQRPYVHRRSRVNELHYDGSIGFFAAFGGNLIQIVRGSYGNREGLETEHTYSVTNGNSKREIQTIRFKSRTLAFDRFADW